ncbi:MAG: hypothetical protein JW951_08595 [Lentisphaerae bacterium]|nr:hypothetical protein [Lentisphaerota bacterium]
MAFEPADPAVRYRVRELVEGAGFGTVDRSTLREQGVTLPLRPGQGFLLEAAAR